MDAKRQSSLRDTKIAMALAAGERWTARAADRVGANERFSRGGPAEADTPQRTSLFEARERLRSRVGRPSLIPGLPVALERMIGPTLDFSVYPPGEDARKAGVPVARIVELPGPGLEPEGFGTGFMVAPGLLLTNHHVLPSLADAVGVGANFAYEYVSGGLSSGVIFELDPNSLFINDPGLDFALVAVKPVSANGKSLAELGFTRLISATGKILIGHPVNIIQYPEGGPKKYATTQNKLLDVLDTGFIHYSTDTLQGSSGSPVFNKPWELVALHHSGVAMVQNGQIIASNGQPWDSHIMSDEQVMWVANEGIRVSSIVNFLSRQSFAQPAKQALLKGLLSLTADPLASGESAPRPEPAVVVAAGPEPRRSAMSDIVINVAGNATIYAGAPPLALQPSVALAVVDHPALTAPEKIIRFDLNYKNKKGYSPTFLDGYNIPLPTVEAGRMGEMLKSGAGNPLILKYHHFSLAMNQKRRLQMWSAVNVDYRTSMKSTKSRAAFGTDKWIPDPRIAGELQIQDDDFYKPATRIDRGHIVRREDNAWGETETEIEYANADTFHWTNCTPQHEAFNQSRMSGLWGEFEDHIQQAIKVEGSRMSIFAGPILDENDPEKDYGYGVIQYPLRFWKVVAAVTNEDAGPTLTAYGLLFDQSGPVGRFGIEAIDLGKFSTYQVPLTEITRLTSVEFPQVLLDADTLLDAGGGAAPERIDLESLERVRLRRRV